MTNRLESLRAVTVGIAIAGALALSACGGGGGGDGGATNIGGVGTGGGTPGGAVPASALQSSEGFIAYVRQVVSNRFDTSEPIETGNVVAPRSDSAEAVGI